MMGYIDLTERYRFQMDCFYLLVIGIKIQTYVTRNWQAMQTCTSLRILREAPIWYLP